MFCFLLFILLLIKADLVPKEIYNKKYLVRVFAFIGGKVILILLIEGIVFYIRFKA